MADKNLQYFESTENNVNKEDTQNETENDQEKNHTAQKSCTNAASVIMHPLIQSI